MKRAIHRIAYVPLVLVTLSMGVASFAADPKKPGAQNQAAKDQGPQVDAAPVGASMAAMRDGFRWGMSPQEVIDAREKHLSRASLEAGADGPDKIEGYEVARPRLYERQFSKCAYCESWEQQESQDARRRC